MKPEFQKEANWELALTALPILEAPDFRQARGAPNPTLSRFTPSTQVRCECWRFSMNPGSYALSTGSRGNRLPNGCIATPKRLDASDCQLWGDY